MLHVAFFFSRPPYLTVVDYIVTCSAMSRDACGGEVATVIKKCADLHVECMREASKCWAWCTLYDQWAGCSRGAGCYLCSCEADWLHNHGHTTCPCASLTAIIMVMRVCMLLYLELYECNNVQCDWTQIWSFVWRWALYELLYDSGEIDKRDNGEVETVPVVR